MQAWLGIGYGEVPSVVVGGGGVGGGGKQRGGMGTSVLVG